MSTRCMLSITVILFCAAAAASSQTGTLLLKSPDKKTEVRVGTAENLNLSILHNNKLLVSASPIAMEIKGISKIGSRPKVLSSATGVVNDTLHPVVPEKRSLVPDIYTQLTVTLSGGWALVVRAYDDGVAYRFRTEVNGDLTVTNEELLIHFAPDDSIWFPEETSFLSHSERLYEYRSVIGIADTQMCCVPAIVACAGGTRIAITEADLLDYPGLYLKGTGEPALQALFPAYPEQEQLVGDRTVRVTKRAPYIARTRGPRDFPWRVFAIADRDGGLIENDIVYRLGRPTHLNETSWIRPGKVAWDWWNANNVYGVSFKSGVNTETYKYFIDFASANRIEYVIFDEGWSKPSDVFQTNPAMDMDTLFAYARKRDVGIILWVTWNALQDSLPEALDRFAAWGASGIKVDFMQRDDQKMVNYYETVARESAKRHLLVDFHGAYKPTGFNRTYPNVLTREGVRGLEHSKWSNDITPRHDVTLPFTRMFAGAMDFTPGAMANAAKGNFQPIFGQPMSQGTRCHQLAMYVVYESPLQMLCDNPSNYMREPKIMNFLSAVPTTWDETRVLNGEIGQYITVARRKGDVWYIGSMTDWTAREFSLDLGLSGRSEVTAYEDGVNADRYGSDYAIKTCTLEKGEQLKIRLAPGGGWAAIVRLRETEKGH